MNAGRRKEIQALISKLEDLKTLKDEIESGLETVRDEEQEYYDNMPEGLQQSDRGYKAEEAASNLTEALGQLQDIDLDELTSYLDTAME
ncbi:hypothetical protein SCHNAPSIDEE_53 [Microbacterium phage Schnapsidee]|uniref:Uncharacterized protein n=1 Tax=Microbacterium phage Schnapsidee TaxID=2283290 RepID=A0A345MEM2_9CAUD|nr:hypothetical protein SCHNAPSIDEE_53 [Microbacterium phage Schnapsidee]